MRTKKEKADLLKAIEKKTAFIENLLPMEVYFIVRCGDTITINGKPTTEAIAAEFEAEIKERNKDRHQPHFVWHEIKTVA